MARFITPIIFIVVAVGLFFGYINPSYSNVNELRAEETQYIEALDKVEELQQVRERLLTQYNAFPPDDLERLQKLLPDNVDNVRLILDLDGIAARYNMRMRNVTVDREARQVTGVIGPNTNPYSSLLLSFVVTATYNNFLLFMQDLETSLRLVDAVQISFNESLIDEYEFNVSIRTYWLE